MQTSQKISQIIKSVFIGLLLINSKDCYKRSSGMVGYVEISRPICAEGLGCGRSWVQEKGTAGWLSGLSSRISPRMCCISQSVDCSKMGLRWDAWIAYSNCGRINILYKGKITGAKGCGGSFQIRADSLFGVEGFEGSLGFWWGGFSYVRVWVESGSGPLIWTIQTLKYLCEKICHFFGLWLQGIHLDGVYAGFGFPTANCGYT